MAGGYYVALSGMRTRLDELDQIAGDIANAGTSGYKAERGSTIEANRVAFDGELQTAIDVAAGSTRVNLMPGLLTPTGRDLDVAIDGTGFFQVQTPAGVRYTRNGRFQQRSDGVLTTEDGDPLLGASGVIKLPSTKPPGKVSISENGTVSVGAVAAGRLSVVRFEDVSALTREGRITFRADGATPVAAPDAQIRSGTLEQSNSSVSERIADLAGTVRSFQALQKALSLMMNDVDGRAIETLGRR